MEEYNSSEDVNTQATEQVTESSSDSNQTPVQIDVRSKIKELASDEPSKVVTDNSAAPNQDSEAPSSGQSDAEVKETKEPKKTSDFVPYSRFQEINSRNKELADSIINKDKEIAQLQQLVGETAKTVKETAQHFPKYQVPRSEEDVKKEKLVATIKSLGFSSAEDVEKIVSDLSAKNKEELAQKEAQFALQNELQSLESKYNGSDGKPKFEKSAVTKVMNDKHLASPEDAYKLLHYDALLEWSMKHAQQVNQAPKSEVSDGSGGNVAVNNQDLIAKIAKGGDDAESSKRLLFKRLAS